MPKSDNKQTLPVNTRSIIRRLGRALPDHQKLRRRNGSFYVVDAKAGAVIESGDLEAVARKLGALQPWERVDDS